VPIGGKRSDGESRKGERVAMRRERNPPGRHDLAAEVDDVV
jgi:hypothetical protein